MTQEKATAGDMAKDIRARIADLNDLIFDAYSRHEIITQISIDKWESLGLPKLRCTTRVDV